MDSSGAAYVAGGTFSTNFPLAGAIQATNHGGQDAFAAKLSASGATLVYSTYLGGSGAATPEEANGIAVDASGNAYVAGVTNSADFPVTAGAFQANFKGVSDAFVTKINPAGTRWIYSTYLGGTDLDWASGIGIDSGGNAYAAGYTSSGDFPQSNPVQAAFGGLVRRVRCEAEPRRQRFGILHLVWRKRIGCRQRFGSGRERQHVPWRPDQLAESAAGGIDPGDQQRRQRGMAGASGSDGSPAADPFRGFGHARPPGAEIPWCSRHSIPILAAQWR